MDLIALQAALVDLPVGGIRYFDRLSSTNDVAQAWLAAGAPKWGLVVADEQTHGRGRAGRSWYTPPGAALAFSLILSELDESVSSNPQALINLTALGALAVCDALRQEFSLPAFIKWPNDVLVNHQKLAGVLVEASWLGKKLEDAIIGIGVNVRTASLPVQADLAYPATCVERELNKPVDRVELLVAILRQFFLWKDNLGLPGFRLAWEERLAWRGQSVQVIDELQGNRLTEGTLQGMDDDGQLLVRDETGKDHVIPFGTVSLRLAGSP